MQARQLLLTAFIFLLFAQAITAQSPNPYNSIGKTGIIVTLTKGEYEEFFDEDSMQRIGSAIINVNTMKVVDIHLTKEEERQLDNAQESRFLSVDPLTKSYPQLTPYQFAGNTPIQAIDLDGLEPAYMTTDKNTGRTQITIAGDHLTHRIPESQRADFVKSNGKGGPNDEVAQVFVAAATGVAFVFQVGEFWSGLKILYRVYRSVEENSSTTKTPNTAIPDKKVPNPNGKNGGPQHQNTIKKEAVNLKKDGYDIVDYEVPIETPGGTKTKRYVDVQGTNSKTGEIKQVQVGKQNKNGTPVSREVKALDDIHNATGKRPDFVPYNK